MWKSASDINHTWQVCQIFEQPTANNNNGTRVKNIPCQLFKHIHTHTHDNWATWTRSEFFNVKKFFFRPDIPQKVQRRPCKKKSTGKNVSKQFMSHMVNLISSISHKSSEGSQNVHKKLFYWDWLIETFFMKSFFFLLFFAKSEKFIEFIKVLIIFRAKLFKNF